MASKSLHDPTGGACERTDIGPWLDGTATLFTLANPNLGVLADNDGFTFTLAPNLGSPSIDAGSNVAATGQRPTGSC